MHHKHLRTIMSSRDGNGDQKSMTARKRSSNLLRQEGLQSPQFPPMKIGGPIEAGELSTSYPQVIQFPPMKIGGPIEA